LANVTSTSWNPGEPNNDKEEDCLAMTITGKMNYEEYIRKLHFICELELVCFFSIPKLHIMH